MLIVVKIKNAVELLWESLDSQERQVVLYFALYVLVSLLAAFREADRSKLKRELREEFLDAAAARP